MCEFCHRHGEGKKWYLRTENYSDDLLSDARRRRFIGEFFAEPDRLREEADRAEALDRLPPFVRRAVVRLVTRRQKRVHHGQVVPIEDLERIFGFVNSIVRLPCVCRKIRLGREARYCYGISLSPDGGEMRRIVDGLDRSYVSGPDTSGFETLTKEAALEAFKEHEREGLCHTIWTFHTPFIGGLCNCDRSDCLALRTTLTHGVPVLFRAEHVARIDQDKCGGCRQCMKVCPFGAIGYGAATRKSAIDVTRCYGCGICRAACPKEAIALPSRDSVPAAARLW